MRYKDGSDDMRSNGYSRFDSDKCYKDSDKDIRCKDGTIDMRFKEPV